MHSFGWLPPLAKLVGPFVGASVGAFVGALLGPSQHAPAKPQVVQACLTRHISRQLCDRILNSGACAQCVPRCNASRYWTRVGQWHPVG